LTSAEKQEKKRDPNNPCLFCTDPQGVSVSNELAYGVRDSYAVSRGHPLVMPRHHRDSVFDMTPEEVQACMELITEERKLLVEEFSPDGYNIGFNIGPAAGQSIRHVHIHLIPRYQGDVENPQGGVRHVIPNNGHYKR